MKRAAAAITITALAVLVGLVPRGALGQCCGDCDGDGLVTVDEVITAVNRVLTGCHDDGICSTASCPAQLATCRDELADCRAQPGDGAFPASGQTTSYGPGSDGDVQAGATLSNTDNGDGTIADNNTGLMWEKKDDSGGIHDKDNTYTWGMGVAPYTMNGTMVREFLATLNRPPCFAGHCDWRIPNVKELRSIVDYEIPFPGPTVSAAFHNAAGCLGCTDVRLASCSCTGSDVYQVYWSSTTSRTSPESAWVVIFLGGDFIDVGYKAAAASVRAVRGGL